MYNYIGDIMEKLAKIRKSKGYSYQAMAQKLNISKTFYWQLENNKRRLSYDLAVKIARVFELKPDDLFYQSFKHLETKKQI